MIGLGLGYFTLAWRQPPRLSRRAELGVSIRTPWWYYFQRTP
jgi:hypothetical protein